MTIKSDSQELLLQLERKERLSRDKEFLNIFQTRLGNLREIGDKVNSVISMHVLFRGAGLVHTPPPDIAALVALIQEQKQQFLQQAEWIRESRAMDALRRKVAIFVEQVTRDLNHKWTAYVASHLPNLDAEVLLILGKVPSFTADVQRIQALIAQMKQYAERFPTSLEQIQAVALCSQSIAVIWGTLGAEEVPPTVLHFLREAGIRGASIDLWTDEVRIWLSNHSLLPYFRIQLTS